jgi:hypothetical protein
MPHPPTPEQNLVEYCNPDPAHREKLRSGTEAAAQIAPTRHTSQIHHSNRLLRSFLVYISFGLLLIFLFSSFQLCSLENNVAEGSFARVRREVVNSSRKQGY